MRFINHEQEVLGKEVEEAVGPLARLAATEIDPMSRGDGRKYY